MPDADQGRWWPRTFRLAYTVIVVCAAVASAPLVVGGLAEGGVLRGLPPHVLLSLAAPLVIVSLLFWHIDRQQRLDDRYDVHED